MKVTEIAAHVKQCDPQRLTWAFFIDSAEFCAIDTHQGKTVLLKWSKFDKCFYCDLCPSAKEPNLFIKYPPGQRVKKLTPAKISDLINRAILIDEAYQQARGERAQAYETKRAELEKLGIYPDQSQVFTAEKAGLIYTGFFLPSGEFQEKVKLAPDFSHSAENWHRIVNGIYVKGADSGPE